jgi:hypothetical protein
MTFVKSLASAATLMLSASIASAQDANPADIFDLGVKFDRAVNQAS